MTQAADLVSSLLAWYGREARDLPWRRTRDPYTVWVSEIILQQTRIDQGTPYFERFMAAFPTVAALARAPEERLLKQWEGLGYYARARNLHRSAKIVVQDRDGVFPATAAEWQALPGVGPYTAGAIASIAFGERVPVVDGNVIRVLSRVFDVADNADSSAGKRRLWHLAEGLVPADRPGDFNQALMELGARVCTPRAPACGACPLAAACQARAKGNALARPVRTPKKAAPHVEQVAAVIRRKGRFLLGKRPPEGLLGGLWEFPSGDVASGESHAAALRRVVVSSTGLEIDAGGLVSVVSHAYSHFKVTVNAYACTAATGTAQPKGYRTVRWVARNNLARYALPRAHQKVLAAVLDTP